jgi:hypothetical protein
MRGVKIRELLLLVVLVALGLGWGLDRRRLATRAAVAEGEHFAVEYAHQMLREQARGLMAEVSALERDREAIRRRLDDCLEGRGD